MIQQTMLHIRNYDEILHPKQFKDGTLLGWRIRVLNWLRYKLEVHVQELVIVSQMRAGMVPRLNRRAVLAQFKADTAEEERLVTDEKQTRTRADAYAGRKPNGQRSTRPVAIDDLAAKYGGNPRAARYANGRTPMIGALDGDFEAIPASPSIDVTRAVKFSMKQFAAEKEGGNGKLVS